MATREEIYKDVEETLGLVPDFVKSVPDAALEGFWSVTKNFELADTALPMKTKQLIGLAVAAQIPCEYCVTFHKEGARLGGATEEEMNEAISVAALTRQGSTIVNGRQQPIAAFKDEVRRMVEHVEQQQGAGEPEAPAVAP